MLHASDLNVNFYIADSELRDYFCSLPLSVRYQILNSEAEICTLGELKQVAEH